MKTNNKITKTLSLAIVLAMIIPSFSFASGKVSKEETVYVNLDEKGVPMEKTSSIWLHSDTSLGKVKDESILKEIKNVKGEEEPKIDGDKIIWETDEKDIFYQGKSNKDLPIDVEVKYYLNDKEVDPKDIAGKSGRIKINLEVKNKDSHVISMKNGKQKTLYTPFVTVAVMNMPLDKFKNVNINSGKLVSDGNNQVITYVALPGVKESLNINKGDIDIPDSLEVKADVTDFEMSPIVITTTSEIPEIDDISGTEDLDELIDGIEKIKEASEKLSEATGKLYEGQISLSGGIDEFVNGVGKVNTGASVLKDGTKQLKDGVDASYKGSQEINKGAGALAQGADKLGKGTQQLADGTKKNRKGVNQLSNGLNQLDGKVKGMPEQTKKLDDGMKGVVDNTAKIQKGQEDLTNGLGNAAEGLEKIKAGKQKELKVIEMLLEGMDGLDTAVEGLKKAPGVSGIAEKIGEGLQKQRMALEGLKDSSNQLIVGVEEVEKGIKQAQAASEQLSTGLGEVNKGQKQISGGISQLNTGSKELSRATSKLNEGGEQLAKGSIELNEGASQANNGTKQLSNGSKELSNGAGKLTNGLGQLDNGAGQLYTGADALSKGTDELSNGGMKLKDGSNQLKDGTKELDEGMKKFHKEGISEISKRIDESDLDIDTIMDTKDKLINLSKEYNSFTGTSEEMESSVKFVMKTEQIKGEEKKEELDIEDKKEEKGGFINWLKNLFKKEK
ncbi:MAG: hypothetical protein KZY61_02065 [Clostridiaceae bacterium]|nr:hypothetical protein [Clostridiaceae bacterium]MBW4860815.1 hypothetical protein [Clostridiaceae bacterium]MBW4867440.1 hypothetical protein [Clostridiaceae bacterium]